MNHTQLCKRVDAFCVLCVRVCVVCVPQAGQVTLEQVLPYLGPTDELQESFNKAHTALREEVAGILMSNLEAEGEVEDVGRTGRPRCAVLDTHTCQFVCQVGV